MQKRTCSECGLKWHIAKRSCTCGNFLVGTPRKRKLSLTNTTPTRRAPSQKECTECGGMWPNAQRECTCGHVFARGGKSKNAVQRTRRSYKCGACALTKGRNHVCTQQPTLVLPHRAAKAKKKKLIKSLCAVTTLTTQTKRPVFAQKRPLSDLLVRQNI